MLGLTDLAIETNEMEAPNMNSWDDVAISRRWLEHEQVHVVWHVVTLIKHLGCLRMARHPVLVSLIRAEI